MTGTGTIKPPLLTALLVYFTYTSLYLFGHLRDLFSRSTGKRGCKAGYSPLRQSFEDFFTRRFYNRIHDCFHRPVNSAPGAWISVMERTMPRNQEALSLTGKTKDCLNLGSYNYLGFGAYDEHATPLVLESLRTHGWSPCAPRAGGGSCTEHVELERELAAFLGKPAALTCGMGFATNAAYIPLLAGPGTLVVSDALNHASIVTGVRQSGAKVSVFRHNDPAHLERVLRDAIVSGQPRTRRPWRKILVIVEGIYSMEGEMCRLPEIVAVKNKYGAYLYLDEAHSIGAMGLTGRGICEELGVDTADVDVMMGTFTKSFGSCGGYLASSEEVIAHLRAQSPAHIGACAMTPPAVSMVRAALAVIEGRDGTGRGAGKLRALRRNSDYFRERLLSFGLNVLGEWGSPIMPVMVFNPTKLSVASRYALDHGVALVIVDFPGTPLGTCRLRICISAAHTKEDLDYGLAVLDDLGDLLAIRHGGEHARETGRRHAQLRAKDATDVTAVHAVATRGRAAVSAC